MDSWRFVDLSLPPSPVEEQLRRYFERRFTRSQFSPENACLAREYAAFIEQYAAVPEESLDREMLGRCGAPDSGSWRSYELYSDGTILDSPLSAETLAEVSDELARGLPPFSVFGITARYVGSNALFLLEVSSPRASMKVGIADSDGNVRVEGSLTDGFKFARGLINQGEIGTSDCSADAEVSPPRYAFVCPMDPGDDEAWIEVAASPDGVTWSGGIASLPSRRTGDAPLQYRRESLTLPQHQDTASAILAYINDARRKLGRRPLELARAQSLVMDHELEQLLQLRSEGSGTNEDPWMERLVKEGSARVGGAVRYASVLPGIAFQGDAADWLSYRFALPGGRKDLMDPWADQLAIATRGYPAKGFGAAAVVYWLFTPEYEHAVAEAIATEIAKVRGVRATRRLENPPDLAQAAAEVASGQDTPNRAFAAALTRLNLAAKGRYFDGLLLDDARPPGAAFPKRLLDADELTHGVVVTHHKHSSEYRARHVVFVWFMSDQRGDRQAARSREDH